jgi:hypothetical protein
LIGRKAEKKGTPPINSCPELLNFLNFILHHLHSRLPITPSVAERDRGNDIAWQKMSWCVAVGDRRSSR